MSIEPLILLPGLICDERLFGPQLPALRAVTEVSVADLTHADSTALMAEQVLAKAPPRFALAGLSMGGYVALQVMRLAPERVTRLALLDSQSRPDTPESTARRHALIEVAMSEGMLAVADRFLPLFFHPDRVGERALVETARGMAEAVGPAAFVRQQHALMGRPDMRPTLEHIACPTLVLAGRQDVLTPVEVQEEMASKILDATLVLLPKCGHLSTLERPQAVTGAMLTWLGAVG
ncbi:MAG: alpha/beta fold hydrolase [Geminicoccaceae bacterium]